MPPLWAYTLPTPESELVCVGARDHAQCLCCHSRGIIYGTLVGLYTHTREGELVCTEARGLARCCCCHIGGLIYATLVGLVCTGARSDTRCLVYILAPSRGVGLSEPFVNIFCAVIKCVAEK